MYNLFYTYCIYKEENKFFNTMYIFYFHQILPRHFRHSDHHRYKVHYQGILLRHNSDNPDTWVQKLMRHWCWWDTCNKIKKNIINFSTNIVAYRCRRWCLQNHSHTTFSFVYKCFFCFILLQASRSNPPGSTFTFKQIKSFFPYWFFLYILASLSWEKDFFYLIISTKFR
jgi:hypothetical protein